MVISFWDDPPNELPAAPPPLSTAASPICAWPPCSKPFSPTRPWHRFCSRPCRQARINARRMRGLAPLGAADLDLLEQELLEIEEGGKPV